MPIRGRLNSVAISIMYYNALISSGALCETPSAIFTRMAITCRFITGQKYAWVGLGY